MITRSKEDYTRFLAAAFLLSAAVLVTFQFYLTREPARIIADLAADEARAAEEGQLLYGENCAACHGQNGAGGIGPALNSKPLLTLATDEALFNLTRTGIPGTIMPAWGQSFGGPFTDEQVSQLITFIRRWEPDAPEPVITVVLPDPARGAVIYLETCRICHGENGEGSTIAPALNDLERLEKLDDAWYRQTIARGRPARGMPTWGTVLSPDEISDVIALIAAWREGRNIIAEIPLARYVSNALFAVRQFDREDADFYLQIALGQADDDQRAEIQDIQALVEVNQLFQAEAALISLLPPEEMGRALFESNCAACHAADGSGGVGPNLNNNPYIQSHSDEDLATFILAGRPGTAMTGFEGLIDELDLENLVIVLRAWQE